MTKFSESSTELSYPYTTDPIAISPLFHRSQAPVRPSSRFEATELLELRSLPTATQRTEFARRCRQLAQEHPDWAEVSRVSRSQYQTLILCQLLLPRLAEDTFRTHYQSDVPVDSNLEKHIAISLQSISLNHPEAYQTYSRQLQFWYRHDSQATLRVLAQSLFLLRRMQHQYQTARLMNIGRCIDSDASTLYPKLQRLNALQDTLWAYLVNLQFREAGDEFSLHIPVIRNQDYPTFPYLRVSDSSGKGESL